MRRRAGFTIIELLASMTIIAILAGIVVPKLGSFVTRARATAVVATIGTVYSAATNFQATNDT
ncbi:MAG: prepilin-type N-terminal cleavage/methylation domain-containing protein, partial [Gemmatimonadota bacterium]|nr:prepilin-type N-terminal cleavage/methylation domain-containing protein [Gemmatimonadota bacterium]